MKPTRIGGHLPWADGASLELLALPAIPEWMEWAACVDQDPETFYPEQGAAYAAAAEVCARCHVRGACQAWGDRVETAGIGARGGLAQLYGYLGGETPAERRRRRKGEAMTDEMNLPVIRWTEGYKFPEPPGYTPDFHEIEPGEVIDEARLPLILDALLATHPEAERIREAASQRPGLALEVQPESTMVLVVLEATGEPIGFFDRRHLLAGV